MELRPSEPAESLQVVESYRDGLFRISGQDHAGAVLLTAQKTRPWLETDVDGFSARTFAFLLVEPKASDADLAVDLVLLGTGARLTWPSKDIRASLRAGGIALEVMDTGAACRTFNVLVAENRRVAAVLLPVCD